jgi:hypothetical protein
LFPILGGGSHFSVSTSRLSGSREVYFFLLVDSIKTKVPNATIRLSASYTVMLSPPFQNGDEPTTLVELTYCSYLVYHKLGKVASCQRHDLSIALFPKTD